MNDLTRSELLEPEEFGTNTSSNPSLESVLNARLSRRSILKGTFGLASTAFFSTSVVAYGGSDAVATTTAPEVTKSLKLNFNAVAKSLADAVTVPAGYTATVLYRLGDPTAAGVAEYKNDGTESGASFAQRAGDHHDGMHFFGLGSDGKYSASASDRGLLVMNHESITPNYLHATGQTIVNNVRTVADEVTKELNAHGISVIEVVRNGSSYSYKKDSSFNRRITTFTEMTLSGPAAKSPMMITAYSTDGSKTRGTVNNCANGYTLWGTYVTCEENWAGYFRRVAATDDANRNAKERTSFARYGVAGNGNHLWATATAAGADDTSFSRWNAMKIGASTNGSDDFRNAPNTYGWIVEIDPFNPTSTPKKRTAMGRFGHENAAFLPVVAGQPLIYYMGDDSRGEYLYKYVSNALWDPADATRGMTAGDKYLDDGKLYVAKFNADGSGSWVELKFGSNGLTSSNTTYAFADQADVLINARLAADVVGATKLDRPEWVAVNPANGDAYLTLTNNSNRVLANPTSSQQLVDPANPRFYNDPKGTAATAQKGNPNGHIIRWKDATAAATTFQWDVFLFGARSTANAANINVSNLTANNDFSSPDGLWFSNNTGLLWIQTDDGAYTDVTNCMMLAAVAGKVGDGGKKTINNIDGATTRAVDTYVGAAPGDTNLRRFLVGPKECEITGVAETPDGKAMFVNIQHPGEDTRPTYTNPASFGSHWPDGGNARPRSATIVITKNDGGTVGGGLA
ncbi:PhoX family phosphatase [Noviherbaspirillum sp. CPCC 100848]|uniref:PhoX family phosphatase n=1 Tax=Noviherbaspirillum album TaxID=3080276 RepID=A0ABU6JBF4_9BURK|nr:PhoX family phosphatase [Noviherbaspirillum sp. CPCC 100848]MEC4720640.1 PhoX family phosphatase [Noviherbaspirillum sp. CPCC 100848]